MKSLDLLIGAAELHELSGRANVRVLDCRFELANPDAGRQAYRNGHIPGAVYADLDSDLAGPVSAGSGRHPLPDPEVLCATLGRLGIDADTDVVVYDAGPGALAARAWWLLRWMGHERSRLLDGGLAGWTRAGYALESGDTEVRGRVFAGRPRPELVVTTAEILAAGADAASLNLVDARANVRFIGREEPIDPVAGHIPGARNLPFTTNLDAGGMWKSPAELGKNLQELLRLGPDAEWSVMCGSGVTACHLVVAGLLAGYREPRLYVGSWSEWVADPSRPVATGGAGPAEHA